MDSTIAGTWQERAARLLFRNQAFIGGKFVDALSGKRFDCVTPRDGSVLTQVAECDAADVDAAVAAARKAFETGVWRDAHPRQRRKVLLKLAQLMGENADELALLETLDMGKPISDSRKIDIPLSIRCVEYYAEAIDKIYDQVGPSGGDAMSLILREPLGVIGVVVPWNFPLMMAVWKLAPALATGNSVVLKPAEQSPLTALFLAELAVQAGLPAGVLNVVPGFGETAGQAIGRHMDVDMLAFTGSTEVGKYFMRYSGESNLKRVSLECGGKSPHIILPDAPDLDRAAREAVGGIFFNQGEVCTAGSRLLVHESIKDEFLELVTRHAARWTPGDPLDPKTTMGAMVDDRQHARVLDYIAKGKAEGAALRLGGGAARTETGGFYIEPTLFDGVTNQMTIAREEIFGPVLSTISFSSTEEAFRIANDTIYGLAAAVWTRDLSTAMKAARAIRAGSVWINCYDGGDITTPFGGFKQSGFGRDRSLHALEKYTDLKSVWIDLS
ncbi:aldehyde dehydrogenase [Niveispirillum sp. BGYR6]|uniref:aldehyde dehydrogenase n=1 Tax=Niveispirillum sp. BGYR6 TaxID=2971249 RepID=UPI0022B9966E|nr:aldehyde dehydrogenase [Niveispirillum sp. BGYR6]MDG5493333.1 aldehyde dehydrogenase [Niveispirillum sp. BGYR6]